MTKTEVAKLLTVASGFDRREVTELTVTAWHAVLADRAYPECEQAVVAHFRDRETRHEYLTVGHVLDHVEAGERLRRYEVEADVRAAKARGIVSRDFPDRGPLSQAAAWRLAQARQADRERVAIEAAS